MCPIVCPSDQMYCPGGLDSNGCPLPGTCKSFTFDCPASCPVKCPPNHIYCDGGSDANSCQLPGYCVANSGWFLYLKYYLNHDF